MLSHVFILIGQDSGSKVIPASLGTTQPQEKVVGSPPGQPTVQVEDSLPGFLMFSVIERKCHIPSIQSALMPCMPTKVPAEDLPQGPGLVISVSRSCHISVSRMNASVPYILPVL